MAAAAMLMMAASAAVSIIGQQQAGRDQQAAAEWQAKQQEMKAGQERASSQRQALEDRRQARLASSRVQALAGGGGLDEGVLSLVGDIAGEGEYNALASIYEGEQSAIGRGMQADGLRMEGKAARRAANFKSVSTVLSTGSSMFGKYGNGGFNGTNDIAGVNGSNAMDKWTRYGRGGD
jgi:hypothetical protein